MVYCFHKLWTYRNYFDLQESFSARSARPRVDKGTAFVRNVGSVCRDAASHFRRKECSNAVSSVQCCTQNHAEVSQGAQNVPERKAHPSLPGRLLSNPTAVATAVPCGLPALPPVVLPCSLASSCLAAPHRIQKHVGHEPLKAQASCTVCFNEQKSAFVQAGLCEPERETERTAEGSCVVRICIICTARRTLLGRHIVGHPVVLYVNSVACH
jgi:hypothetical protein